MRRKGVFVIVIENCDKDLFKYTKQVGPSSYDSSKNMMEQLFSVHRAQTCGESIHVLPTLQTQPTRILSGPDGIVMKRSQQLLFYYFHLLKYVRDFFRRQIMINDEIQAFANFQ